VRRTDECWAVAREDLPAVQADDEAIITTALCNA
jgi:hypothetical protein